MPRPRVNLDALRDEMERRIAQKHTHRPILSWLAGKGVMLVRIPSRREWWSGMRVVGRERQARMLRVSRQSKEQKLVPGTTRKLVSLWLYWTPNEPERDEPLYPIPCKRQKASKAESLIPSLRL